MKVKIVATNRLIFLSESWQDGLIIYFAARAVGRASYQYIYITEVKELSLLCSIAFYDEDGKTGIALRADIWSFEIDDRFGNRLLLTIENAPQLARFISR